MVSWKKLLKTYADSNFNPQQLTISLFIIVFKDDNGIRYEKLNELKSVKHNLIKNFDSRVCNTDTIKTESNSFCCNNQSSETNITNTRNGKEELIKHYMTCITEL